MKQTFDSYPVLSFLGLTFAITFSTWFSPLFLDLPTDISFALMLIGGCGPLIAGYTITVIRSQAQFRISSWPVFLAIFLGSLVVLWVRLYLIDHGMSDGNGNMPRLDEISGIGYGLFLLLGLILGWNASNWNNGALKDNYLTSFLFDKK